MRPAKELHCPVWFVKNMSEVLHALILDLCPRDVKRHFSTGSTVPPWVWWKKKRFWGAGREVPDYVCLLILKHAFRWLAHALTPSCFRVSPRGIENSSESQKLRQCGGDSVSLWSCCLAAVKYITWFIKPHVPVNQDIVIRSIWRQSPTASLA